MVCSPFGPHKYEEMCNFNQYALGVAFAVQGGLFLYNARRLGRLERATVPASKHPTSNMPTAIKQKHAGNKAEMLHNKRLMYASGFTFVGLGGAHLIGGSGTMYASSTFVGIFCDFVGSATLGCVLYMSFLHLRGAQAFRNLVQLPTNSDGVVQKRMRIIYVLDVAQGPGAFAITFGVWLLLASGVITRVEYYSIMNILVGGAGIRSMFENIYGRVRTLVRVDELQQNAGGDNEAKRRRRNTLKSKARVLIFDMLVVLILNVFLPLSVLIFGSVNSSTQMLIHQGVSSTITAVGISGACIVTHKEVSKICAKQKKLIVDLETKQGMSSGGREEKDAYTVANESGMSVVGNSEIAGGARHSVGGLFSDVGTDV